MSDKIKIVEVGPRDGLQNESTQFSVAERVEFILQLIGSGLCALEGGSFVSPKAIPQMAESEKVWKEVSSQKADISFLVANQKGFERALDAKVKSIAVFTATSSAFTQKNIGMSVKESIEAFAPIVKEAKAKKLRVRGYVSTVFGCPYEGVQNPKRSIDLTGALFKMGCDEVSIGDTVGVAHPKQVAQVFSLLAQEFDVKKLAGHFHDTRGMALLNLASALELGVRIFDSSIAGLGGCPYAPGSSGNLATEEAVWFLEGQGMKTNVDVEKLLKVSVWLEAKLKGPLRSKLAQSKPKKLFYW